MTIQSRGLAAHRKSPAYRAHLLMPDRHVIEDIRSRSDDPENNFILCTCEWRGRPEDFTPHRKAALKLAAAAA